MSITQSQSRRLQHQCLHYRTARGVPGVKRRTDGSPAKHDHYRVLAIMQPGDNPRLLVLIETLIIIFCNLADTAELREFLGEVGYNRPAVSFVGTNVWFGLESFAGSYTYEQMSRGGTTTAALKRLRNKDRYFGDEFVS